LTVDVDKHEADEEENETTRKVWGQELVVSQAKSSLSEEGLHVVGAETENPL
jgi:hypothetical protein